MSGVLVNTTRSTFFIYQLTSRYFFRIYFFNFKVSGRPGENSPDRPRFLGLTRPANQARVFSSDRAPEAELCLIVAAPRQSNSNPIFMGGDTRVGFPL